MNEEPSQAGSPPASPVPPSEPDGKADVQRKVEAETVHLPSLTEAQQQLKKTPAVFAPGEDYGVDDLLGSTVAAAESGDPTRNKRPTMVTGQPPKPRIHEEVDPKVSDTEKMTEPKQAQGRGKGSLLASDAGEAKQMGPRQGGPHATSELKEMEERLDGKLKAQAKEWDGKLKARDEMKDKELDEKLDVFRAETQQQLKAAVDREDKLQQMIVAAEDREDKLQQMIDNLKAEIDQLHKENEELVSKLTKKNAIKLKRERTRLRTIFAGDLQEVKQECKDKVDQKDAEIRELGKEVQRLTAERDGYKAENDQLKERLKRQTAADSNEEQQDGPQGSPPHNGFPHVLTPENGSASAPSVQGSILREPRPETPPPSPPSDP